MNFHFIVQSLDPRKDILTGEDLFNNVISPKAKAGEALTAALWTPENRDGLFQALKECLSIYESKSQNHDSIFLHLECHGSQDSIELQNGEKVNWDELTPYLISLSRASNINLILASSCCYGMSAIKSFTYKDFPLPCYMIIGPLGPIASYELFSVNRDLVTEFYNNRDLKDALGAIRKSYPNVFRVIIGEVLFLNTVRKGIESNLHLKRSIKTNIALKKSLQGLTKSDKLKKILDFIETRKPEKFFELCKRIFFMIDIYPENSKRFECKYEDVFDDRFKIY